MSEPPLGVIRQLESERKSVRKLGLEWDSVLFTDRDINSPIIKKSSVSSKNRFLFKIAYYKWLIEKSKNYEIILLRYSVYDPFQLVFVLTSKCRIYTVHHTLEEFELKLAQSKLAAFKLLAEKILGSITLSFVDGIVAVLDEIKEYELDRRLVKNDIPSTVYTNGIDYYGETSDLYLSSKNIENDAPVLLFISSEFAPWQGLESLIHAAAGYSGPFICHLVGDLSTEQHKLVREDERFVAHGKQSMMYISDLIRHSDIGLSALALHKKNLSNVPALKVREYLKEGLAVYAGHGDVFPCDFRYFRNGTIEMAEIIKYALENRKNDRKLVSDISREYIEKELILSRLNKFLKDNYRNSD